MDNYRKVKQPKADPEKTSLNEIRIQASGKISHYVRYATEILTGQQDGESEGTFVTIKALGAAINRAITVAETLKSEVQDIHQVTTISSTEISDVYEPLVEGLQRLVTVRQVSSLEIFLGTSLPSHFDTSHFGYQPPLSPEEFEALVAMKKKGMSSRKQQQRNEQGDEEDRNQQQQDNGGGYDYEENGEDGYQHHHAHKTGRGRNSRGRGRGRRQPSSQQSGEEPEGENEPNDAGSGYRRRGRGRGSRRGRGRGSRGRGRGENRDEGEGYLNEQQQAGEE